ncbi:hypothetical protein [Micromonospora fulviviridis]|uniref:hypothetical protein n=1 Tax=Micromonospora fulviviridis TaxID=47860 RepID=UPI00166D795C|nr:hypothetical protein [Micromonospora fulviviridis]
MKIEVDGEVVARLKRGARQSFDVQPGQHRVRVRVSWQSSLPVEVTLDGAETVTLEAAYSERSWRFTETFLRPEGALDLRVV